MFVLFLADCSEGFSWTTELIAKTLKGSSLVFQQHLAIRKISCCLHLLMNKTIKQQTFP